MHAQSSLYDTCSAQAWSNVPLNDKLRWTQTSTDVSAWILVPKGTRTKDVEVLVSAQRLRMKLRWHGNVINGQLHGTCKAADMQWVIEDNEVCPRVNTGRLCLVSTTNGACTCFIFTACDPDLMSDTPMRYAGSHSLAEDQFQALEGAVLQVDQRRATRDCFRERCLWMSSLV